MTSFWAKNRMSIGAHQAASLLVSKKQGPCLIQKQRASPPLLEHVSNVQNPYDIPLYCLVWILILAYTNPYTTG